MQMNGLRRERKIITLFMATLLSTILLAGCGKEADEGAEVPEVVDLTEGLSENEIVEAEEPEQEKMNWTPEISKDYDEEEYMKYPISSVYFLEKDGYGYELAISVKSQKEVDEKDVKIFVSKLEGDEYQLQQVIQNEVGDSYGNAMNEEGLYLMDVNFDGMNDILVHDGFYGSRDHSYYSCYLYNGEEYELCESFLNISNPSVDTERKQVLGYMYDVGGYQCFEIYAFENGEFYKERELSQQTVYKEDAEGDDPITYEYRERIFELKINSDGTTQWESVSEEKFSEEENGEEFVTNRLNGEDSYWKFDLRWDKWGKDKLVEQ